ncbi:MAG: cupin [Acidimicrobiia bacterium]
MGDVATGAGKVRATGRPEGATARVELAAAAAGGVAAGLAVGAASEGWAGEAEYFEYTRAANPIGSGHTPRVPLARFPAALHRGAPTGLVPLDVSADLGIDRGPATSPGLLASFVRIRAGEEVATDGVATSEMWFVLEGSGRTAGEGGAVAWGAGDVLVRPGGTPAVHAADEDATLYHVTDEPLLRYLGVAPVEARFAPTRFPAERIRAELDAIAAGPRATDRNRLSVLLAGATQPQTLTATHVLWVMFGLLPEGAVQRPHRHQSVALDLIVDCEPGCFTLVGARLDERGEIVDPTRVDWEPGGAFITPPGLWHAHVNRSGAPAHLLPVQDAGLQTYLRSLDIRFAPALRAT